MSAGRSFACAEVLDGAIYVMGGRNDYGSLSSVECFDPETQQWSEAPQLSTARHGASCLMVASGGLP